MTTTINNNPLAQTFVPAGSKKSWLVGNARLVDFSGLWLSAHIAHAGLIMLWAGATTVMEVARLDLSLPLGEQGLLVLPHLAMLGIGIGEGGTIVDTDGFFAIGILHLAASAVLGAGGLFHLTTGADKLEIVGGKAKKFHFEWNDPRALGVILGHHLLFLGLGALAFVLRATQWGGIYDANLQSVRIVDAANIDPLRIFGYLFGQTASGWNPWGMAAVDNLEDIIGGHIWLSGLLIFGGIWHIIVPMLGWAKKVLRLGPDALLSYSLGGLAFMAFTSCLFVSHNTVAFPPEFYGSDRLMAANIQAGLAVVALVGHLWHAYRARTEAPMSADAFAWLQPEPIAIPSQTIDLEQQSE
ncbi:chlorophyll a/b binding light-harvesting protein [filamentous cyanobacterium LEGE 11480]|uniref:Chlorophyll a/b binding light-harvesting protein n=1 Tax=Romeriopsis navalis LEGE 11480 TaxID=2777977 RepID=A0A928Z470_9CYAN|nr:chlorophyll a/b binding light-harvesting protein [Romeriopsis navalis]MBE9031444.1 chlorophyll a/b binding light-harvesting protein [Romeriopsis navalis LEGE 11480]